MQIVKPQIRATSVSLKNLYFLVHLGLYEFTEILSLTSWNF